MQRVFSQNLLFFFITILWLLFGHGSQATADDKPLFETRYTSMSWEEIVAEARGQDDRVWPIYEDRSGILWIGTDGGGLNRFDPATGHFIHFRHDPDDPDSISSDYIWAIYEDALGILWIGTDGGGAGKYGTRTPYHL